MGESLKGGALLEDGASKTRFLQFDVGLLPCAASQAVVEV